MAVVCKSSIEILRKTIEERDDIPKEFPSATKKSTTPFIEYEKNWIHQTWQTERDNGSLYPSEDSYTPYLEII